MCWISLLCRLIYFEVSSDQSLAIPISRPTEEFWFCVLKNMSFWLKPQPFYFFSFTVFIVQSVIQFNIYQ